MTALVGQASAFAGLPAPPERHGIPRALIILVPNHCFNRSSTAGMTCRAKRVPVRDCGGTHDVLILQSVSPGSAHGHTIAREINLRSPGFRQFEHGSPPRHPEDAGWLFLLWGVSENHRQARYCHLSHRGKKRLDERARLAARVGAGSFAGRIGMPGERAKSRPIWMAKPAKTSLAASRRTRRAAPQEIQRSSARRSFA